MRNLFLTIILLLPLTIFNSCQENEDIQSKPTFELLKSDLEFQEMTSLFLNKLETVQDFNKIEELSNIENISNSQNLELLQLMGFANEEEFLNFQNQIINLNQTLSERYDFSTISDNELIQIITRSIESNENNIEFRGSNCGQRYNNCKSSAKATYILHATGCMSAGIGIASLSFGFAAPIGGAIAGACMGAAHSYYNSSISDCGLDYQECLEADKQ